MDYTTQSLAFKIKKVLRYVWLYGIRRTLVKVKGQYHMKKRYETLPSVATPPPEGGHVGLIGCGNFAYSNLAYYLNKNYGRVMRASMDVDANRAASLYEAYGLRYYSDDAAPLIADPEIDLVYVASNHASHAEYAIQALEAGKCVHIEKPHVVNEDQLRRLCRAMEQGQGRVTLGFNRPSSRIGALIQKHLDGQSGPAMFNWFLAGHEIPPDHWYFKEEEGGRVLGNLCHWTDFVLRMVAPEERYPLTINPTRWDKSDCDIAVTYVFGGGHIAAITFSAKGHTFEGVRETFSAHRGNVLITMNDFKHLTVEDVEKKHRYTSFFRDHGHQGAVRRSYQMVRPVGGEDPACSLSYVWETGELFLKTKESLERNERVVVEPFEPSKLREAPVPS